MKSRDAHVHVLKSRDVETIRFFPVSEVVVACPSPYLDYVRSALPASIGVAAQNCSEQAKGAFTGEKLIFIPTKSTLTN